MIMNDKKLTILPCQNPEKAKKFFNKLLFEEAYLLFVVLGTGPNVEKILELSTKVAGSSSDPGRVVWIKEPGVVFDILNKLDDPGNLLSDLKPVLAFALSIRDKVVDAIKVEETPVDYVRVFESFMKALKG